MRSSTKIYNRTVARYFDGRMARAVNQRTLTTQPGVDTEGFAALLVGDHLASDMALQEIGEATGTNLVRRGEQILDELRAPDA